MLPQQEPGAEPEMDGEPVEMGSCTLCGAAFALDEDRETRRCSARCRRLKLGDVDRRLENAISTLLATRDRGATICPSEAAKVVAPDRWRDLMERVRWAGHRMAAEGRIAVLQGGRVVDTEARGPVRFGLLH